MKTLVYRKRFILSLVLSLSLSDWLWGAEGAASDVYREAQLKETAARDPQSAIGLYEKFLKQPSQDRSELANAYLHLGLCQYKIGQVDQAKVAWKKIVADYSDQADSYAQALEQLQKTQAVERITEVRYSTPEVKVVYGPPATRWSLDFIRLTWIRPVDGKGDFIGDAYTGFMPNFDYYLKPGRLAVGFSGGWLATGNYNSENVMAFHPHVRIERHVLGAFLPYVSAGPAIYRFQFQNVPYGTTTSMGPEGTVTTYQGGAPVSSTRWTAGVASEAGIAIGWTRGFTLTLGYSAHLFPQVTPGEEFIRQAPDRQGSDGSQNHGLRLIGGPVFALSFRW